MTNSGKSELERAREEAFVEAMRAASWSSSPTQQLEYFRQAFRAIARSELASASAGGGVYKCKALGGSHGANYPPECDWPLCGCDPHADKVIEALQESGMIIAPVHAAPETGGEPCPECGNSWKSTRILQSDIRASETRIAEKDRDLATMQDTTVAAIREAAALREAMERAMKRVNDCADRIANRDDVPYGTRDYNDLRTTVRLAFVDLTKALPLPAKEQNNDRGSS